MSYPQHMTARNRGIPRGKSYAPEPGWTAGAVVVFCFGLVYIEVKDNEKRKGERND